MKKRAYTEFIKKGSFLLPAWTMNYVNLPRNLKKKIKRHCKISFTYNKETHDVTVFSRKLLSAPVPPKLLEIFTAISVPLSSINDTVRMRRYSKDELAKYEKDDQKEGV